MNTFNRDNIFFKYKYLSFLIKVFIHKKTTLNFIQAGDVKHLISKPNDKNI